MRACREGGGIALLIILALYGDGRSTSSPGRFIPGKGTRYPLNRRLGGVAMIMNYKYEITWKKRLWQKWRPCHGILLEGVRKSTKVQSDDHTADIPDDHTADIPDDQTVDIPNITLQGRYLNQISRSYKLGLGYTIMSYILYWKHF